MKHLRCWAMALCVLSGCKPAPDSTIQSLENFSATKIVNRNLCMAHPKAKPQKEDIVIASRIRWSIHNEELANKGEVEDAARLAITSVPKPLKKLFIDFKGEIHFTDSPDRCSIVYNGIRTRTAEACMEYGPTVTEVGGVKILEPEKLTIYLKPDVTVAQHGLVLQFGYFFSEFYKRLVEAEDSRPGKKHYYFVTTEQKKWATVKRALAQAYIRDIKRSNGTFNLNKIMKFYDIQGYGDPNKQRQAELDIGNYVMAEAFDSYFCNSWARHDAKLAQAIARGDEPLSRLESSRLKNSACLMRDMFPESYRYFRTIAKTYFDAPEACPRKKKRQRSDGSSLMLTQENTVTFGSSPAEATASSPAPVTNPSPASVPNVPAPSNSAPKTYDSYMSQLQARGHSGSSGSSSDPFGHFGSPDLLPLAPQQQVDNFIKSSASDPFGQPSRILSGTNVSIDELINSRPMLNRPNLASQIPKNGDPVHDIKADIYNAGGGWDPDPEDVARAQGVAYGAGKSAYNLVYGGWQSMGQLAYDVQYKPYVDAAQMAYSTGSLKKGYESFDPTSGSRDLVNGVGKMLSQKEEDYDTYVERFSNGEGATLKDKAKAGLRVTPIIGGVVQGFDGERPDGTPIEPFEQGSMIGDGIVTGGSLVMAVPSMARSTGQVATQVKNATQKAAARVTTRFKTPVSTEIASGGSLATQKAAAGADDMLRQIDNGTEQMLAAEAEAVTNSNWTAVISDTHMHPSRKLTKNVVKGEGLKAENVALFQEARQNFNQTLKEIGALPDAQKPSQLIFGGDYFDAVALQKLSPEAQIRAISKATDQMRRASNLPPEKISIIVGNHDGVTTKLASGVRVLEEEAATRLVSNLRKQGYNVLTENVDKVAVIPNSRLPLGPGSTRLGHLPINNGPNLRNIFKGDSRTVNKLAVNEARLGGDVTQQIGFDIHQAAFIRGTNWSSGAPLRTIQAPTLGGGTGPGIKKGWMAISENPNLDPVFFEVGPKGAMKPGQYTKIIDLRKGPSSN